MSSDPGGRVVRAAAIGGGHGLSRSLQALRIAADHVTAIVTVADDGGSSGRLRRDLDVIPPGDLRMAIAALSGDDELTALLQYRFALGELAGHSLGNLIIVALQDLHRGDTVAALDRACLLLGVAGRVLPSSTVPLVLNADAASGTIRGQVEVAQTPAVERVWQVPEDAPATPAAIEAIAAADLVVLGPGSLYTSVLPNLLVPGIAAAVCAAPAPVVFVANLREQPGETEGMSLADHLAALRDHVPGLSITAVVAHDGSAPQGLGRALTATATDREACGEAELMTADLLDGRDGHDPAALAAIFAQLLRPRVAGG